MDKKLLISTKNVFILAFLIIISFTAISLLLGNAVDAKIIVGDIASPAIDLLVLLTLVYAAKISATKGRRIQIAWIFMTIAFSIYTTGDVLWAIIELGLNQNPFPSMADIFYLSFYPIFALGIYYLPRFSFSRSEKLKIFLDMGIVITTLALIFWIFIILPTISSQENFLATLFSLVYIIGDFLLLFVLLRLIYSKIESGYAPVILLGMGILALVCTDSIFALQTLQDTYVSGGLLDTGWILSFVLVGLAAFLQISEDKFELRRNSMIRWFHKSDLASYLPLIWVLIAFILLVWANETQTYQNIEFIEIAVGFIIFLVIIRQVITLKENKNLYTAAENEIKNRKEAEHAARESEIYYRTIFENSGTSIILIEEDMTISRINSEFERLTGFTKDEIEGQKKWTDFVVEEDMERIKDFNALKKHPKTRPMEYITKGQDKTGNIKDLLMTIVTIPGTKKLLASIIDITKRLKAEKTLLKSEERLKLTLDAVNEGVWDWNVPSGNAVFSPSYYTMLDYSPYEFPENYENWRKLVHPDDIGNAEEMINKHIKNGEGYSIEMRMRAKSGKWLWILAKGRVVERDDHGYPIRIVGTHSDITKSKSAENELINREKRFRTLIYNSTDIIRILDENGIIVFDSPSSAHILGYPEGSLVGKDPLDYIHPDDLDLVKKDLNAVYKNMNPGIPTEFRIRTSDGTYLPVESISQNLTDVPGIAGILVTTHPIKERKVMEDALREGEEKYRNLFESDPDYTLLLDLNGILLEINNAAARFTGRTREKLIGKKFVELGLFPEEDLKFQRELFASVLDGQHVKPFPYKIIDKNGVEGWVESQLIPLKKDEKVYSVMVIATDITERKIATDNLKASVREKEILIQEIHHRVKNNMQIISSLLNLQSRYVEDAEAVNVLKESQNRVKSMAMIHEKLYQSEDLTHINFVDYIESLVSNLFYSYNVENGKIQSILEIENVNLNMETAVPCGLIISELVSNSLKYAFPNGVGKIFVSLKSVEEKYQLNISDDGIGLPQELEFNNLESLGLLLVKSLTEQIDGQLRINRRNGTEFNIVFQELKYNERI
jgi:PAS domain S-box-containing protein